ncbi:hypothetical protein ACQPW3_13440 [Actinosynnema sp. CA-248983]
MGVQTAESDTDTPVRPTFIGTNATVQGDQPVVTTVSPDAEDPDDRFRQHRSLDDHSRLADVTPLFFTGSHSHAVVIDERSSADVDVLQLVGRARRSGLHRSADTSRLARALKYYASQRKAEQEVTNQDRPSSVLHLVTDVLRNTGMAVRAGALALTLALGLGLVCAMAAVASLGAAALLPGGASTSTAALVGGGALAGGLVSALVGRLRSARHSAHDASGTENTRTSVDNASQAA